MARKPAGFGRWIRALDAARQSRVALLGALFGVYNWLSHGFTMDSPWIHMDSHGFGTMDSAVIQNKQ